jgi:monovalent cation/hydrogen antiporter
MNFGAHAEWQLLGLMAALGLLLTLAPTLKLPVPILLVLGGLGLGFVPGLPRLQLPPDIVLVAFLPPLLYSAAFFTSLRDLRTNVRPISLLALGLVAATTCGVAVVAHEFIHELSWAAAFTLGAVLAPTDALAVTEIAGRLQVPRRIVAILEGESLINDGTALVLYKAAVAATVSGSFSLWDAGGRLLLNIAGGVAVGVVVAVIVRWVRRRVDDPPVEVALALLSSYVAYLPAAALGVSGVLATVTVGVFMGWHTPQLTSVQSRLSGNAFWEILVFLLNGALFVLVGLQLHGILNRIEGRSTSSLIGDAVIVSATVLALRIVWVPIFTYVPRWAFRSVRERDPSPPWQAPAIVSWAGIRGAVSLAAALALPTAFPGRDLIVFLTFAVILVTLVGQGLTLPLLIRVLGLEDDGAPAREEAKARIKAAEAALARLDELVGEGWIREDTAERLRGAYGFRRQRFEARLDADDDGAIEERSLSYQRLRRELLEAEREAVLALRSAGVINDDVMYRVQRDLDLEDSRLDVV